MSDLQKNFPDSQENPSHTEQRSGLWTETKLTRHGSGFPFMIWFVQGLKLFLLTWYLHISKVAGLHVSTVQNFCCVFLPGAHTKRLAAAESIPELLRGSSVFFFHTES